jgi:predicted transcriptional regulator
MELLTSIFSSATNTKVMQTLAFASEAVSLREIAYRANLAPSSVTKAIDSLLKTKIILEKKVKNRRTFFWNKELAIHKDIIELFKKESQIAISKQAKKQLANNGEKMKVVLENISAMTNFVKAMKSKNK